ncbi:hypothetical protein [Geminocystis herdmanii]|uniref:hypothetical protein n=1 Tax=Geminocystis herdmanii TaxID=669359 RepID=UPI00034951DB|nr:hypothetical protein [Geminocystis herdmanii]
MTIITVKRSEIPPKTPERIKEIMAIRDEDIDYSDIPELDEEWFKDAQLVDYSKGERFKPLTKTK